MKGVCPDIFGFSFQIVRSGRKKKSVHQLSIIDMLWSKYSVSPLK